MRRNWKNLALKVALPRTNGRWSVYNDLLFENYSTSASLITDANNQDGYTFSMRYLKLFTQVRREFGSGLIRPFVNAGISNAYSLQATTTYTRTFYSTTTTNITSPLAQSVRRHELGLTAGGGVAINRLSVELRYERTNGLINAPNSSTSRQNIWLLLGYRLR